MLGAAVRRNPKLADTYVYNRIKELELKPETVKPLTMTEVSPITGSHAKA